MTLLRVQAFAAKRRNAALFKPLNWTLQAGQYLEITGANGSGKTTLLRVLAGLYDQYEGEFHASSPLYSGHRLGLDPLLSAVENLRWLGHLNDQNLSNEQLLTALRRVGVVQQAVRPVGQLSQGQQRRVGMAYWLLSTASVWLLDEPLNALDSGGRSLVTELVEQHLAAAGAVVCATHLPLGLSGQQVIQLEAADA